MNSEAVATDTRNEVVERLVSRLVDSMTPEYLRNEKVQDLPIEAFEALDDLGHTFEEKVAGIARVSAGKGTVESNQPTKEK